MASRRYHARAANARALLVRSLTAGPKSAPQGSRGDALADAISGRLRRGDGWGNLGPPCRATNGTPSSAPRWPSTSPASGRSAARGWAAWGRCWSGRSCSPTSAPPSITSRASSISSWAGWPRPSCWSRPWRSWRWRWSTWRSPTAIRGAAAGWRRRSTPSGRGWGWCPGALMVTAYLLTIALSTVTAMNYLATINPFWPDRALVSSLVAILIIGGLSWSGPRMVARLALVGGVAALAVHAWLFGTVVSQLQPGGLRRDGDRRAPPGPAEPRATWPPGSPAPGWRIPGWSRWPRWPRRCASPR